MDVDGDSGGFQVFDFPTAWDKLKSYRHREVRQQAQDLNAFGSISEKFINTDEEEPASVASLLLRSAPTQWLQACDVLHSLLLARQLKAAKNWKRSEMRKFFDVVKDGLNETGRA